MVPIGESQLPAGVTEADNKSYWLSLYIYYAPPHDQLLTGLVQPLVEELLLNNLVDRYFFIRYKDRGDHIRLRVQGNGDKLLTEVKPFLNQKIIKYLDEFPSTVTSGKETGDKEADNSIAFVNYVRETKRYGGQQAIQLAERQFHSSSSTVLKILSSRKQFQYGEVTVEAIKLHIAFAFGLGMTKKEARLFFEIIYDSFLSSTIESWLSHTSLTRESLLNHFEAEFNRQGEQYVMMAESLWTELADTSYSEKPWMEEWVKNTATIHNQLKIVQQNNGIELDDIYQGMAQRVNHLWIIYLSYFHMTNNRIGVRPYDECYLAYLISRSFEEMK
jgi:thiopeptide-type bacteriocin biosynthesis protein